jgi:F-type H+-transporting ATPase subunit a
MFLKRIFTHIIALTVFVGISLSSVASESSKHGEAENKPFNAGEFIFEHIGNSYGWHVMTIGHKHVVCPLPIIVLSSTGWHVFMSSAFHHSESGIVEGLKVPTEGPNKNHLVEVTASGEEVSPKLDISITKNVAALLVSAVLLLWIFLSIANRYKKNALQAPKGMQSLLEPLILFVRDDIARPCIGEDRYAKFMPYLLTVFFFIFINNLMGLVPFLPGGANVTGNISVTLTLAIITFVIITFSTNKGYWGHIINAPGVPWWLKIPIPLMPVVEIIGVITKPVVLMIRLSANITAGHIIALGFVSLIFIFGKMMPAAGYGASVLSVTFMIFMSLLELLVAFIQAYVFTMLSALYFGMAKVEHHHEHAAEHAVEHKH